MKDSSIQVDAHSVALLCAGRTLSCNLSIHELLSAGDIQSSTTLHLVTSRQHDPVTSTVSRFWVYCRTCGRVRRGRLRVRCAQCSSSRFLLSEDSEPRDWISVRSSAVPGRCLEDSCGQQEARGQFYFLCNEMHENRSQAENCVPLSQVASNLTGEECPVCGELPSPMIHFTCEPRHHLCLECFGRYAAAALEDNTLTFGENTGVSLRCPVACQQPLDALPDPHHFLILGEDFYRRLKERALAARLMRAGGLTCPRCGLAWEPETNNPGRNQLCAEPLGCGQWFCGECRTAVDSESALCSCSTPQEELQGIDDTASVTTIRCTTKPCPRCRVPTEKNSGCNHMTCAACQFQWCWICVTEWEHGGTCQELHWFQ